MSKVPKKLVSHRAVRVVDVDSLRVDPTYQRGVRSKVKRIVRQFDPDALGVLCVGERDDGSLWVVDGLQRLTALKQLGIKTVRADVFASSGPEQEAAVFARLNRDRCALAPIELFNADLTSGDPTAASINYYATANGFTIPTKRVSGKRPEDRQSNELACTGTLLRAFKSLGEQRFEVLVSTLAQLWPGDPRRTQADIVGGLWAWFGRHKENADVARLVDRLNGTTPQKLLYTASLGIGGRDANIADTIERIYRKRKGGSK